MHRLTIVDEVVRLPLEPKTVVNNMVVGGLRGEQAGAGTVLNPINAAL